MAHHPLPLTDRLQQTFIGALIALRFDTQRNAPGALKTIDLEIDEICKNVTGMSYKDACEWLGGSLNARKL